MHADNFSFALNASREQSQLAEACRLLCASDLAIRSWEAEGADKLSLYQTASHGTPLPCALGCEGLSNLLWAWFKSARPSTKRPSVDGSAEPALQLRAFIQAPSGLVIEIERTWAICGK